MYDESVYAMRALRAGALGYIKKSERSGRLLSSIRNVLDGKVAVSPQFAEELIYRVAQGQDDGGKSPIEMLSDRELEVLQHVGAGESSVEDRGSAPPEREDG